MQFWLYAAARTHAAYLRQLGFSWLEVPVTVEDELGSPLIQRLDGTLLLADKISSYGGVLNILVHTNNTGHKLEFEERLLTQLKDKAWIGTLKEFGKWWSVRDKLTVLVETKPEYLEITISNPASESISGVSMQLPTGQTLINTNTEIIQMGNVISVSKIDAGSNQTFRVKVRRVMLSVNDVLDGYHPSAISRSKQHSFLPDSRELKAKMSSWS